MEKLLNRLASILGSSGFFVTSLVFFVFQSVWIAFSAVYPMAFDEDFHFGLIKVYSHYWLPFLSQQPPHANAFGAVARDPSYLYHYLMSFPYRLIALVFHGQTNQIISLRLINIVLFCVGLILFRRILLRVHLSRALTNVSMLLFTLIPIVPQLAGQINYDNLILPLTACVCLLTFRVIDEIRRRRLHMQTLLILFIVCTLASLVKYAFLPITLAVALFVPVAVLRGYRSALQTFWQGLRTSWRSTGFVRQLLLVTLSIIAIGMFIQRDGVNLLRYHTIVPDCSRVLPVKQCSAYSVWERNYIKHASVVGSPMSIRYVNPVQYVGVWLYSLWYRLFFAVNGPASNFTNYPPLPLPSAAAVILALAGVWTVFVWRKRIFNNPYYNFFLLVSALYLLALGFDGYSGYHYTDEFIDMNGRYLLPVLLFIVALMGQAFSLSLRNLPVWKKSALAAVTLLLFLQGGGVLTFITRSDTTWYQPSKAVLRANNDAQNITRHVIVRGPKTYSTPVWFFN
ncbi:MAG TPA: hypothetical protein VGS08_05165 [Candidatus Saccharimonadales bacterium]|nr:hypothetical protein [Candidatus Saccharimonadales bacterium]